MNGNEEMLYLTSWSTITLSEKSQRFLNAYLYARWLVGRRNAEMYTNGILYRL
jgi:hypothetical protein